MKEAIREKIEGLLSKEYYCSLEELNGKGTVFSVNSDIKKPYIKILAYRNCVVVCTSKDLAGKMQEILHGKNRDEILPRLFMGRPYIMFRKIFVRMLLCRLGTIRLTFFLTEIFHHCMG